MKLIRYEVEVSTFDNRPNLLIVVDKVPDLSEMRFDVRDGLYFAEKDGFVRFFAYTGPDRGFGGHVFDITLTDGTNMALRGPWSSRSGVMNQMGFPESTEVTVIETESEYPGSRLAGHVTLSWLRAHGIPMLPTYSGYEPAQFEPTFEPVKEDGTPYKPWTRDGLKAYTRPRSEVDLAV